MLRWCCRWRRDNDNLYHICCCLLLDSWRKKKESKESERKGKERKWIEWDEWKWDGNMDDMNNDLLYRIKVHTPTTNSGSCNLLVIVRLLSCTLLCEGSYAIWGRRLVSEQKTLLLYVFGQKRGGENPEAKRNPDVISLSCSAPIYLIGDTIWYLCT